MLFMLLIDFFFFLFQQCYKVASVFSSLNTKVKCLNHLQTKKKKKIQETTIEAFLCVFVFTNLIESIIKDNKERKEKC